MTAAPTPPPRPIKHLVRSHLIWALCSLPFAGQAPANSPTAEFALSGTATYDRVPIALKTGLDYSAKSAEPIRRVPVELLSSPGNAVIQKTRTDDKGKYEFKKVKKAAYTIRIEAQIEALNVAVKDNTQGDRLYRLDNQITVEGDTTIDVHAAIEHQNKAYVKREAAPFAILMTLLDCYNTLKAAGESSFPKLDVFWSAANKPEKGSLAAGEIKTSHYRTSEKALYILGKENVDTDEFDAHIIAHEWGHYYTHHFGRDDSKGGSHDSGDHLLPTVAFSEGFATALACNVMQSSVYADSRDTSQAKSWGADYENNKIDANSIGWFSEASVISALHDIMDGQNEPGDPVSLGFAPVHSAFKGSVKTSEAFTTIHSMVAGLNHSLIDSICMKEDIGDHSGSVGDAYGAREAHHNGNADNLPVYRDISPGKWISLVPVGPRTDDENKLDEFTWFKFTAPADKSYTVETDVPGSQDIDLHVYAKGVRIAAGRTHGGDESATFNATTNGTYIFEVQNFDSLATVNFDIKVQ